MENQIAVLESYLSVHNYAIQYSRLPSQSVQTVLLQGQAAQGNANNSTFKSQRLMHVLPDLTFKNSAFCPQSVFYVFCMGNRTHS